MSTVTAIVEINFKTGIKTIEMLKKDAGEIDDCEEGKIVVLNLTNGEQHTGIFNGMDDEDVMLRTLDGPFTLCYKIRWISSYFEEIKI